MTSKAQVPKGWNQVRLGDVLKLEYGVSLPERERQDGQVPVLGSAGLVGFHSQATTGGPGIVIGRKGSIGTVTWVSDDFVPIDTTYFAVPTNGQADLHWLYHLLAYEDLSKLNRATGVPGLNREDVYALKRAIPPLLEQRSIAAVLGSFDEAIKRTDAVIAATEQLHDSLLHELLTRGVPGWHTEWKEVLGLGTMPANWKVVRLGEVCDVTSGLAMGPNRSPRDNPKPYLTVANVKADRVTIGEPRLMELTESEYSTRVLRTGDVVLVEGHAQISQLGRAPLVPPVADGYTFQNHLFRVRPGERCTGSDGNSGHQTIQAASNPA